MPWSSSVAVVGIGGLFPAAPDLEQFWELISRARSATREVPPGRWQAPAETVYHPEVGRPDHVYSTRGCFIDKPPHLPELGDLDPLFHLLVTAGGRAFNDAQTSGLDLRRVGVIIGNLALPSETSSQLSHAWLGRTFAEQVTGSSEPAPPMSPQNRFVAGLPAGILARSLGLGGVTTTLDAACASSLYAIKLAMDELLAGRADAMLTGGVSRPDPLYTQMGFSQLRALSKRGICSPFDASGDGLVVGEGAGIFLLKRTADAIAAGDRIYGIIRAVGLSNDVGGSLLAPSSEGQVRAMEAAYRQAGWQPEEVDLIECHATGTPVGDAVEVASLRELWHGRSPVGERCVIGSVKSNIGHLLTAAGAAALTKVLLAMARETLPPTAGFSTPQPAMQLEESPFRVLTAPAPWRRRSDATPRRAAVSAFGFGGINAHLLVEEWIGSEHTTYRALSGVEVQQPEPIAIVGMDAGFGPWQGLRAVQERLLGGDGPAPVPPQGWRGARQSRWFREEGLDRTPFAGWFIDQVAVSPGRFRIPPKELEEMLPQQVLMLQTAANALQDAGTGDRDPMRSGVFVGIALDLHSTDFCLRWTVPQQVRNWARQMGRELSDEELATWTEELRTALGPSLSANRTMGALGNIVASRIARECRFGGPGFTLSAEENSGIRALETAVRLLQSHELDQALVGAVDLAGDLRAVLGRHAVHPYSATGTCRPFDQRADGPVVGEGACALVLKRLSDAKRDGNRIYALIRGIGTAHGDLQTAYGVAVERAYAEASVDPASVGLLVTAADGSPEQDRIELQMLRKQVAESTRRPPLTSTAAGLGHSGAASGLASVLAGSLALYQQIIPGCPATDQPWDEVAHGPLLLPATPRHWLRNREEGPRRAGVSSRSVDGSCSHLVLEEYDTQEERDDRRAPLAPPAEQLFPLAADTVERLQEQVARLQERSRTITTTELPLLSRDCCRRYSSEPALGLALVAADREQLSALLDLARKTLELGTVPEETTPALRERLFFTTAPLASQGQVAFVFPGSGNHYPDMGRELFCRWPEILRRQDHENRRLKDQFQPDLFWNGRDTAEISDNHRAVIFGQVATGCGVSDLVRGFGVTPAAMIGYSLGESAALFASGTWRDRDLMFQRMQDSTLFTHDLAGECRAARRVWGLPEQQQVTWRLGVVTAPAEQVRRALSDLERVYLLIVNSPDECVVGGDAEAVARLVQRLDCHFFPLAGVTTVHCEVARAVAGPYHDLHLFDTTAPAGVAFYSGAAGARFQPTRESAAAAILEQALHGIDYPATIEAAWNDGVRIFLEMGPGNSCSRMIGRILEGRPHLARSACFDGQEPVLVLLRLLASQVAHRVPLDLSPLCSQPAPADRCQDATGPLLRLATAAAPFQPPRPPAPKPAAVPSTPVPAPPPPEPATTMPQPSSTVVTGDPLLAQFSRSRSAEHGAHAAFLALSDSISRAMAEAISLQATLRQALGSSELLPDEAPPPLPRPVEPPALFNRQMCLEFAIGSVGKMLGPQFAEADSFPTRVRLPDEPLMLVDRITALEGEPCSMASGRVVTEHDILPGAWYLDGGRIPTCIAVEAGQADLFLSGYLGIDFITRGLAVYRLLDAVVTFHRGLPGPGETIRYDIRIERFFRQGDTWLLRFFFEATVNGEPLLSMRDGCAGFFSAAELAAGKGIVRPAVDPRPTSGIRRPEWHELLPLAVERYDADQLDCLRNGDLAGCFGPAFSGLAVRRPLTIPGGRMRLVHRVNEVMPEGGRYGLGRITAEADIHPDDWFITCHFVDDRVMPGTLMYECCMHTLRILLLRMGWVAEADSAVWEPVPGVASKLCCRGQVLETTKTVTYEVAIREIGYGPEPYVVADALMYADGKPIVEIGSMSCRLSGTDKRQLEALWQGRGAAPLSVGSSKPAIYTKEQILAYSNGNPSEGFGEPYRIFDRERKIARLPGPPFQFMDRVTALQGEPWIMQAGALAEAQYDLPADAWFFAEERQPRMPFCVLLEAALQPCGWLAAYVGSALTSPVDLSFRNLGGRARQHRVVTPASGTLTCTARLTKAVSSGGMVIQEFDFSVADCQGMLYEGETMFGFFSQEALANQVGIRDADPYRPTGAESARGRSLPYPDHGPFPGALLRMIDQIELYVADGGPAGLGYLRGSKQVDPDEWFFKAHFYQDPVTPGSLGLESFLQLLKFAAVERWGWQEGTALACVATGHEHRWLYRGQIVPANRTVTVEAWITAADDRERRLTASGYLAVDNKPIYQMIDFTVRMEEN
ncbi:polyketide synthase [Trichlorobacter ammonificans]|uniref:3-hydroxyacyl-[acyl-carrier-protein] dehydratase FabA n=1 Tax=Trichlorobacter ammonificans TaxID=2916410 RepID=A0ABM9DA49_9BACT|nr:polyketide synthase [Trichlorobacter ammonificans]CAH2031278.1 3-hydroxyacyl-[acyl-carrier-protein] dehydratase FabA [Trichlorobacter ammonificans]